MVFLGSISKAAKGIITSWYDSCEGAFFVAVAVQLTISIGGCDCVSGHGHARAQSLGRVEQFKSSVSLSASRRLSMGGHDMPSSTLCFTKLQTVSTHLAL